MFSSFGIKFSTFLLHLSIVMVPFSFSNNTSNDTKEEIDNELLIKQEKKDLLAGNYKAICYSGYRTGQHPDRGEGAKNPSDNEILEDLDIITNSGFQLIRLYDSGSNTESVLRIIKEYKLNIKVMLGIWLRAEISNHQGCSWLIEPIPDEILEQNKVLNYNEIQDGIRLANSYSNIVVAVNVGNEALVSWNDHMVSKDSVISYVTRVKKEIQQPVSVADNYEWWATEGHDVAKVVDFISVHIYPVWEGKDIDEGMPYSIENIQKVRNSLPNSKIVIGEAGWASVASEFGERANEHKQKQYFDDLMQWSRDMNITTFFFEAFDENWKGDPNNPMGAEKHWGLYTINRKPKLVMKK
ncbi:MAG: glycosyl hydrolase family 17 protein [Draconibacterium sp.]|nr:glycosyl hydrolase family 17 protein [Draconibacterium sp.]